MCLKVTGKFPPSNPSTKDTQNQSDCGTPKTQKREHHHVTIALCIWWPDSVKCSEVLKKQVIALTTLEIGLIPATQESQDFGCWILRWTFGSEIQPSRSYNKSSSASMSRIFSGDLPSEEGWFASPFQCSLPALYPLVGMKRWVCGVCWFEEPRGYTAASTCNVERERKQFLLKDFLLTGQGNCPRYQVGREPLGTTLIPSSRGKEE